MDVDGEILGRSGKFVLTELVASSANGWRSIKLVHDGNAPKRNWWLGWNGERLSRNADTRLLATHQPQIHDWVISILSSGAT